jgi:transcriptional regulator GlxA family with amidase domain
MRSHAEEPLTVAEIANAVGVGPRALQAAFRASHGITPRQLLAEIRLEEARARLLAPEAEMTVTDAALASGFAHFGRFAAAYRERYGELPSETLRRALNQ